MKLTSFWAKNYVEKIVKISALQNIDKFDLYKTVNTINFFKTQVTTVNVELLLQNKLIIEVSLLLRYTNNLTHFKQNFKYTSKDKTRYMLYKEALDFINNNDFIRRTFHFIMILRSRVRRYKKKIFIFKKQLFDKFTHISVSKKKKKPIKKYKVNFLKLCTIAIIQKKLWNFNSNFCLASRNFLTHNVLKNSLNSLLYRLSKFDLLHKIVKKKTIENEWRDFQSHISDPILSFFNMHKKLSWKMRTARYVHWNLETYGTLNEWRYNKLLGSTLHTLDTNTPHSHLVTIIARTYSFLINWKQSLEVLNDTNFILNGRWANLTDNPTWGDILELPFGRGLINFSKTSFKYFNILVKRAKRYSYKTFLRATKKRKHIRSTNLVAKIYKRLPIRIKFFGKEVGVDVIFNIFGFLKLLKTVNHNLNYEIKKTSVLTLQNWRFRFD